VSSILPMDQPAPEPADLPPFDPVPTRARHDGWTPARQRAFVAALVQTANVAEAAAAVGMSRHSAYRLRARPDAAGFAAAWDAALAAGVEQLEEAAIGRAIHGTARPVFYGGQLVGERRYYNDRLAMLILRARDPRYRDGAAPDPDRPWQGRT